MMSRVFLFAAVAALAAAQESDSNTIVFNCLTCGTDPATQFTNCCDEASVFDAASGQCYNPENSDVCTLCVDCPELSYNAMDFSEGGITGSTSGGGFTVGTSIYNGMKGYTDVETSSFQNFPKFMRGIPAIVFDREVDDWSHTFICNRAPCDLYVMAYRCRLCNSQNMDLFHTHMVHKEGFLPNSCGPTFQLTEGGHEHQFTVYHKEVLARGRYTITPGYALDFVWAAIGSKRVPCLAYEGDEEGCNKRSGCSWNLGKCQTFWCSKPSCSVCPKFADGEPNLLDVPRPGA